MRLVTCVALLSGCFGVTDGDPVVQPTDTPVEDTDTDTVVDTEVPWAPSCSGTLITSLSSVSACPASTVTVRAWDGEHADLTFTLGDGACSLRLDIDQTCGPGDYWRSQAVRFDWAAGTCGLPAPTDDAVATIRALAMDPHDGVIRVDLGVTVTLRAPDTGLVTTGTMDVSVEVPDPTTLGNFQACSNAVRTLDVPARTGHALDVLFVVQDDPTAVAWQPRLVAAAPALFDALDALADDWRVGVVTTDAATATEDGRLQGTDDHLFVDRQTPDAPAVLATLLGVGTDAPGLPRGLLAARRAASMPTVPLFQANRDFFRNEAELAIVFFATSDDQSSPEETATGLAQWLSTARAWPELATASALTGPDPGGCGGLRAGSKYIDVARRSGGVARSICDDDVASVLDGLTAWAGSSVVLPDEPVLAPSLKVEVQTSAQRRRLERDAYTWDPPRLLLARDDLTGADSVHVTWAPGP